jgi:glycerol uptake facilitator-like aquaporin
MALSRKLSWADCAAYLVVQFAGAVAGVWIAHVMFGEPVVQISQRARDGLALGTSEIVATFGLVGTIMAVSASQPQAVPAAVGLYIASAYWFTASTSFANPAVTFARSLSDSFAGIAPHSVPAFVAAQLLGAMLAYFVFKWLLVRENRA